MIKKNNVLTLVLLILVNLLIVYYSDGDAARYISIKYLFPERGIDIALSVLNIGVIMYLLTNIVLNTLEVKNFIIIRIGKKGFNSVILKKWLYLLFLLIFCNAGFELYIYNKIFYMYLIPSYIILIFMLPLFLKFTKMDYYFILCMISIFITHIVFQLLS